jgi:TetR/AcrR family transcriptional regulator, transcriptional repressor for nem operon
MSRRSTQTRDRILQIGSSLFASYGWEATTLEDILSAAGITKGAFYHYFKSKQDLCLAVLDRAISEVGMLLESIDRKQSPPRGVDQFMERLGELNRSGQWTSFRLLVRLSTDACQSYPVIQARLGRFWNEFLRELQSLCPPDEADPALLAGSRLCRLAGALVLERYLPQDR